MTNREIASQLFIALRTVEGHVEHILFKLGFTNRTQVASWVVANGGRSLSPIDPPGNLRRGMRPLLGRDLDVQTILGRLERRPGGVITLTGPGGVGKTSLALEVGARVSERFPDGIWFVGVASVRSPGQVAEAVARTLSIASGPARPLVDVIADELAGRAALLVIDNVEQVLDAAPAVQDLIARSIGSAVLVTSREPLNLYGEYEHRVNPLEISDSDDGGPAVALFVQHAERLGSRLILDAEHVDIVRAICRRLDGLPLALELAAARLRSLSPAEILSRLDSSAHLLSGGRRDSPSRHRGLIAAFEWSYDLLSDCERIVFRRLAVFRGGFGLDAAETVCAGGAISRDDVFEALHGLIAKSMLILDRRVDEVRYRMLQTIHDFADHKLGSSGEVVSLRRNHSLFYRHLAESEETYLRTSDQVEAFRRIDIEMDNLRQAVTHASLTGDTDTQIRLVAALVPYWWRHGDMAEGLAFARALPLGDPELEADLRAVGLLAAASICLASGDDNVLQHAQRLVEVSSQCKESAWYLGWGQFMLAGQLMAQGPAERSKALELLESSMRLMRQSGAPRDVAVIVSACAELDMINGELEASVAAFEEVLALISGDVDYGFRGQTLYNLGHVALAIGDRDGAGRYFAGAVDDFTYLGADVDLCYCALGLATLAQASGHMDDAAILLGTQDAWLKRRGLALQPTDKVIRDQLDRSLLIDIGDSRYRLLQNQAATIPPEQAVNDYLASVVPRGPDVARREP